MEYNTDRNKLIIPEYGRNIQKIVAYACTIEDRQKRTETANYIVNIMANIISQTKDQTDYKHKLWDFLFYISDFKINVDSPYPIPPKHTDIPQPKAVEYNTNDIHFRHYGRNLENIVKKAMTFEEGEEKKKLVHIIANHMKKMYVAWNKDTVSDEIIAKHLLILSNNQLKLDITTPLTSIDKLVENNTKLTTKDYKKKTNEHRMQSSNYKKQKVNYRKK